METAFRPNVQFNGIVNYNFPLLVDVLCPIAVQRFPFDTQSCKLTIGSWTSHGGLIDVHPKHPHGDLSATKLNVEWEEVAFPAVRNVEYYACCPEPYPDVTFTLTLRRKPTYYVNHIIIPSVLITVISLLGFILPVESGEKVSLQVTILLSLAVFQLLVADSLPPDSASTPYICEFWSLSITTYFRYFFVIVSVFSANFEPIKDKDHIYNKTIYIHVHCSSISMLTNVLNKFYIKIHVRKVLLFFRN